MSAEANTAIVRRYQEAHNRNDLDALDDIVAVDLISHAPTYPGMPTGLELAKQAHRMNLALFPDTHVRIDDLIAEGDRVAMRFTQSGTHSGEPFLGVLPSGRRFEIEGMSIFRVADGKIAEHWAVEDQLGLLTQLGLLPAPG